MILIVAMLFATFTVSTAQTKVVANKVQLTNEDTKNAAVLGTDEKGNIIAKELGAIELGPIQEELEKKLNAGTYTGTAADLANSIADLAENLHNGTTDPEVLQPLIDKINANEAALNSLGISDVQGLQDELTRIEGLIANAGKVKTVNSIAPDDEGNVVVDISGKVDKEVGKGLSSNDYTDFDKQKVDDIEPYAEMNVQADWNETDTQSDAYILNKPTIPDISNLSDTYIPYVGATKDVNLGEYSLQIENNNLKNTLSPGSIRISGKNDNSSGFLSNTEVRVTSSSNDGAVINPMQLMFTKGFTPLASYSKEGIAIMANNTDNTKQGTYMITPSKDFTDNGTFDLKFPAKSGTIALLSDISGGTQVQSDWSQTDNAQADFIKNKPTDLGQLIKVTENGNTGYRLSGYESNKFAPIGKHAIDLTEAGWSTGTSYGASGDNSVVSGGKENTASALYSVVSGGLLNTVSQNYSTISGGEKNEITGYHSFIGGGKQNKITFSNSAIGSGYNNKIQSNNSSIGGGQNNIVSGQASCIVGGSSNSAESSGTFIGGGWNNKAQGEYSIISGGKGNYAKGKFSAVLNGTMNNAESYSETVIGCFSTKYTPVSATGFENADRLFVIGNGKNNGNRSDALIVYKNGNMDLNGLLKLKPMAEPTSPQKGMIYFDQTSNKLRCYDGASWRNLF